MVDLGLDWNRLAFVFPSDMKQLLQAIPFSLTGRSGDKLAWAENLKGSFDLKSAYNLVLAREGNTPFTVSWIWKAPTIPHIKTFMWHCAHNSIIVKECLTRRGVMEDEVCPIYNREVESSLHALRDCHWVQVVWIQLGVQMSNHGFWMSNLTDWLNLNGRMNTNQPAGKPPWKSIFPFAIWNIWKNRNGFVFNRKNLNPNLVTDIQNQAMEFMCCVVTPRELSRRIIRRVHWEKPPHGWAKLNTDRATEGNLGLAGCGGLISDKHGARLAGFTRNIGSTSSLGAELLGLRDGLALCYNLNITSLIVELDAKSVVDIFRNPKYENNIISPIMDDCRQLMMQFQHIQFKHCYREANRCADMLARMGIDHELGLVHYVHSPEDIRTILNEDCNGLFFSRTCTDAIS